MGQMRESSVLFSLKQLMTLEQDRVHEEDLAARTRAEAEAVARREAELEARARQEALLRAEDARRREQEAVRREQEARLQAIRLGEIERARIEALQKAHIDQLAQAQEHERRMAELEHDGQKRRLKRALIAGAVLTASIFGGGAALYFGSIRPAAEAEQQREHDAVVAREARVEELKVELGRANAAADRALQALTQTKGDADRARAERDSAEAKKALDQAQKNLSGATRPSVAEKKPPCRPCAYAGDPMCDSLCK